MVFEQIWSSHIFLWLQGKLCYKWNQFVYQMSCNLVFEEFTIHENKACPQSIMKTQRPQSSVFHQRHQGHLEQIKEHLLKFI